MILLLLILIRDLTFASTISIAKLITSDHGKYIISFYALQIIAAPFQASYSDHSCRKKALVFSFLIIGIGHIFLYLSLYFKITFFLLICVIINGVFGNVFPIALAGLMDINYLKSPKKMMTLVMTALGIAWLAYEYGTILIGLIPFFWVTTAASFVCAILCYYFFEDKRDRDLEERKKMSLKKEFFDLIKVSKQRVFFLCIKSYFLTEIVYFGLFYYHLNQNVSSELIIVTTYALGYIGGNIIVNFSPLSLKNGSILGFSISFFSIVALLFSPLYAHYKFSTIVYIALETFFSLGYGIFDPCVYAFIGKREAVHKRGKVFGIVDSSDNLSELAVSILLVLTLLSSGLLLIFRCVSLILLLFALLYLLKAFKKDKSISDSI